MKTFTLFLLIAFFPIAAAAQGEAFDKPLVTAEEKDHKAPQAAIRPGAAADSEIKMKKPEGYPATDLPEKYTGFRIELMATDTLLPDTSAVFFKHGNIVLENLEGNKFSYSIGNFQEEGAAAAFLKQFILPVYRSARIIRYKDGKRM